MYELEQFPGAIHGPLSIPGISILLFASRNAVIDGVKNQYELWAAKEEIGRLKAITL